MKKLFCIAAVSQLLLASCDGGVFSAGSYPYSEDIELSCTCDTTMSRLTRLKASGLYENKYSFFDGPSTPPSPYYGFYFFSSENNCILFLVVGASFDKNSIISLVSIKDPYPGSKWQDLNHGLDEVRQKKIIAWFNKEIRPSITCK